jgi:hypothetical protein
MAAGFLFKLRANRVNWMPNTIKLRANRVNWMPNKINQGGLDHPPIQINSSFKYDE